MVEYKHGEVPDPIRFERLEGCGHSDAQDIKQKVPRRPSAWRGLGRNGGSPPRRGLGPGGGRGPFRWLKHCDIPDAQFNPQELRRGVQVEYEHTDDEDVAKCIAKAHLLESPDYYRELEKMERKLKRRRKKLVWKREGSGCAVGAAGTIAAGLTHPCDETYVNQETGEEVWLETTRKAHAKMPDKTKDIEKVAGRPGVRRRKGGG